MMEKEKINSFMISICAVAVIAMGVWTYTNISSFITVRHEWKAKSKELIKVRKNAEEIQQLLGFYQKEKKEFQNYLFQEKDIPEFLDGLSTFAQKSGINIVDMKTNQFEEVRVPQELKEGTSELAKEHQEKQNNAAITKTGMDRMLTLAAMPINIKVQGPYNSLIEFYRHLENFGQLISISNVEIATKSSKYPALECAFILKIYSLKTLKDLGKIRP